jgi:PAS domain S-box-containing protein
MKGLSSRFHLALGLASLIVSVMLLALHFGLVPDRDGAVREGRLALSETVAMGITTLLERADDSDDTDLRVARLLGFTVRRNPALLSAGLRRADGELQVVAGDHTPWMSTASKQSTEAQITVPIRQGERSWGQAELRFAALHPDTWWAPLLAPPVRLIGIVALSCFALFYLYLWRMLRHLDPSSVVPGRVRTAFDTLAEGVMVVDAQGRIVLANRALADVVGAESSALVGQVAATLAWTNQAQAQVHVADLPWTQALADGRARLNVVMYLADRSGRRLTFMVNCSPVPGAAGKTAGVLVSFDDVTELEEKEIQLRLARDEADAANRAKSDFLANMSHEIRTPMNAILGYTELMRRGYHATAEEVAKYLDIIHGSGKHLLELINDILDLSKVEAGRLDVERIACEAHIVVRDVVRSMQVKAEEKGVSLRVEFPEALPATVLTDPSRLRQIVTNLVGNGLKFTQHGGVTVTLRVRQDITPPLLAIDIADTGIGIAADKLGAIFEPFVQAEASTTRLFGGTGLGLAISRRFARALGGDVTASSVPGQGSCFHVSVETGALDGVAWLSAEQLVATQAVVPQTDMASWRFKPARVLVVDDGAENRQLVRLVLEAAGLQVIEAEHGGIALECVAAQPIDLVLMDVQMPVMDGYTATRELRARGYARPVLALTANAMKGFEHDLDAAGFTGHLTKPVDIDGMLAELARHLEGTRSEAESVRPSAAIAPSVQAVESRLAHHPRLRKVVRNFALQMPGKLHAMRLAVDRRDFAALAALAHWLKGSAGTVGFDDFFGPAEALEKLAQAGDVAALMDSLQTLRDIAARMVVPEADTVVPAT